MRAHFILFVADQRASTRFYERVLGRRASLDTPGMTEFELGEHCVVGLMPATGIQRLLGEPLPEPLVGPDRAKAELYLVVDDAGAHHSRALACGGRELSPLQARDWGHQVAYSLDPDGHVLAFAECEDADAHAPPT